MVSGSVRQLAGAMAAVDDSLGALPYGVYLIDEVEGIIKPGKEMVPRLFIYP